ncbi:LysR family transcriptional regulator [Clostridia bacterium]|nr:LysR family transcriptional regulator [Clostridia bacterium]
MLERNTMNIESLKTFKLVVEAKSISKVASQVHMSQSALSQLISRIEDSLGYKLLERSNKGVEVTDMGKIVVKYSENIIRNYEMMNQELKRYERKMDTVMINGNWSLVNYSIPCILYKVKKRLPDHKYELFSSSNEDTVRDIVNDICDIGFISCHAREKSLLHHVIGKEKVVLVAAKDYNIPDKIDVEDLYKYEFVKLKNRESVNYCLNKELDYVGVSYESLNAVFEVDSISSVKSSLENRFGISFLPYMAVKKELFEGRYKIVEVAGLMLEYDIFMITKQWNQLSESVRETLNLMQELGRDGFC